MVCVRIIFDWKEEEKKKKEERTVEFLCGDVRPLLDSSIHRCLIV